MAGSGLLAACAQPTCSSRRNSSRSCALSYAKAGLRVQIRCPLYPLGVRQPAGQLPVLPAPQLRRRQPCQRGSAVVPSAGLYSLPPDLYHSLQTGCGIAYLLALGFSALPILTGESLEANRRRYESPDADESAENIRWSVMGVLSVLPFINPMAWVFAALDDDDSSALYYSLALVYALPYLANGFELDAFALLSLLVCAFHIQLERVAQTEPVEVELPSVLRRLVGGIPQAVRSLGRYSSRLGSEVGGRTRSAEEARKRRPDRKYLEERSREARAELEEFDKRRRERAAAQQKLWQQQQQQQPPRKRGEGHKDRQKERER